MIAITTSFLKSITPIPLFHYHHKTTLFQQSLKHFRPPFFILTYVTLALLSISYLHFARSPASILLIIIFYARIPKSASQPRHHRSIIFSQLDFRSKMDKKEDRVFFLQRLKQRGQNENSAACQIIKKTIFFPKIVFYFTLLGHIGHILLKTHC